MSNKPQNFKIMYQSMKKLLILAAIVLQCSFVFGQVPTIFVSGQITYADNGLPVVNHPVTITIFYVNDTMNGTTNLVSTGPSGNYDFSTPFNANSASVAIEIPDCNGIVQTVIHYVDWNNSFIVQDFSYCASGNDCQAGFTYQPTDPLGLTLSFSDLSTGNPTNWQWEFGDGTMSFEQNPEHTYSAPGLFEVCLTISNDSAGCQSVLCLPVMVGNDTSFCQAAFEHYIAPNSGLTVGFIDFSFGSPDSWYWDFGDNNVSTEQNPVHTYSQEGVYNVCLTISSADSSCYDQFCGFVVVSNASGCMSMFSWYPPMDSMPGNSYAIQFIDASMGDINTWSWDFGDGSFSTEQNPLHTYALSGSYEVCLTITASDSCQSTWCELVYVGENPGDCYNYFTYEAAGNTLLFNGFHSTNLPAVFEWSFGDGTSGTGQQISHTFASEGTYYVTLISSDANNCTAISGQVVVVGDSIMFNQVYGQVFEGNFPLASGLVMIFDVQENPGFNPFNDFAFTDSDGVFLFPYVPNGEYVLYAIPLNFNGYMPTYYGDVMSWDAATRLTLGTATNPYNINLLETEESQNNGNGSINGLISLEAERSSMVDKVKILLFDQDHKALNFTNVHEDGTFEFDNLALGSYYIYPELPGMNSGYISITLTESSTNSDVFLTMTDNSILGEAELRQSVQQINVFPNPVVHQANLLVVSETNVQSSIEIFDMSGRLIQNLMKRLEAGNNQISLPVEGLENGFYLIRIVTDSGEQHNTKMILNR